MNQVKLIGRSALAVLLAMQLSGCALGLAAGAGAVAADEIDEERRCKDGFDPLESARGKEDGCT